MTAYEAMLILRDLGLCSENEAAHYGVPSTEKPDQWLKQQLTGRVIRTLQDSGMADTSECRALRFVYDAAEG